MQTLPFSAFAQADYPVALAADEVQVWRFPHRAQAGDDERLRALLAAYLACAPGEVAIDHELGGKPFLRRPGGLAFNLSHSRGHLLLALGRNEPLGVDVESLQQTRPFTELAERFFAPPEAAALKRLAPALQPQAFLRLWCCKEAIVKALGRGIAFGIQRLGFELDRYGVPLRLNVIDTSADEAAQWQITQLVPAPGHVGAVAWRGPPRRVRAFVPTTV